VKSVIRLVVDADLLATLGLTVDELAAMGLRTFFEYVTNAGFDVKVSCAPAPSKDAGRLTIKARFRMTDKQLVYRYIAGILWIAAIVLFMTLIQAYQPNG
jgi:hypothetical protein